MPIVTRSPRTPLPGSDPQFHMTRFYMTIITYKGKRIMGFVASCRHQGCNFTGTWISDEARVEGAAQHRRAKTIEARTEFLVKRGYTNPDQIEDALLDLADRFSHTLDDWRAAVGTIWGHRTDKDLSQMPPYNSEVRYMMGMPAKEAARRLTLAG